MDQIKRDLNTINDVALQINGLAYKIKQEKTISNEKMEKLNSLTDVIDTKTKNIIHNISAFEEDHAALKSHVENLKKGIASQKRKASEAILLSDTYSQENKKLHEEVNTLKLDLSNTNEIMNVLSFDDDFAAEATTSTPKKKEDKEKKEDSDSNDKEFF